METGDASWEMTALQKSMSTAERRLSDLDKEVAYTLEGVRCSRRQTLFVLQQGAKLERHHASCHLAIMGWT